MKEASRDKKTVSNTHSSVNSQGCGEPTWKEVSEFRYKLQTMSAAQAIHVLRTLERSLGHSGKGK